METSRNIRDTLAEVGKGDAGAFTGMTARQEHHQLLATIGPRAHTAEESAGLSAVRTLIGDDAGLRIKENLSAGILDLLLLHATQWERNGQHYYGKGAVPPRDYLAWQPLMLVLVTRLNASAKSGNLRPFHMRELLALADRGFAECRELLEIAGTARIEQQQEYNRKKRATPATPAIHGPKVITAAWWPNIVAFHGGETKMAARLNPVTEYFAAKIGLDLGRAYTLLYELTNERNPALEFWRARAREYDVRRVADPAGAVHPIYDASWMTEAERGIAGRESAEVGLTRRLEGIRNSARLFYPVADNRPAVSPLAADKSRDSQLYPGWSEGRWVMFRHTGFDTRFFAPAEAFDATGAPHPEYVALMLCFPAAARHTPTSTRSCTRPMFSPCRSPTPTVG